MSHVPARWGQRRDAVVALRWQGRSASWLIVDSRLVCSLQNEGGAIATEAGLHVEALLLPSMMSRLLVPAHADSPPGRLLARASPGPTRLLPGFASLSSLSATESATPGPAGKVPGACRYRKPLPMTLECWRRP